MTYGFQLKNGNGEMVVDGVNDNYLLWFTMSVSATFTPEVNNYGSYGDSFLSIMPPRFSQFPELVTTAEPPVVCGYSESGNAVFGYCTGEQYKWDGFVWFGGWEVGGAYPTYSGSPSVTASMKVAVFSRNGSPKRKGDYGLQVKNNGNVVYDSRSLPFMPIGPREFKRYGDKEGRTIPSREGYYANYLPMPETCIVDRRTVSNGWPVISSLTQRVIPGLGGSEFGGNAAVPIMALSVSKSGDTFTYKFVALVHGVHSFGKLSSGNLWYGVGGSGKNEAQLYNTGGGQGAYNLIAFAKMPASYQ